MAISFPALPADFEPTRATLHAYAHAVGAIPRAHGIAHPKWWHVSLKVRPEGLVTDPVPLPDGGAVSLRMDLRHHVIVMRATGGSKTTLDMRQGATATEVGERLLAAAAVDHPIAHKMGHQIVRGLHPAQTEARSCDLREGAN